MQNYLIICQKCGFLTHWSPWPLFVCLFCSTIYSCWYKWFCVAELWCSTSLQATLPIWLMFMAVNALLSLKSLIVTSIRDSNPELIRTAEWERKTSWKNMPWIVRKVIRKENSSFGLQFQGSSHHGMKNWHQKNHRFSAAYNWYQRSHPFSSLFFFCFTLNFFSVLLLRQKSLEVLSLNQHNFS